jgi:hypothetical protein
VSGAATYTSRTTPTGQLDRYCITEENRGHFHWGFRLKLVPAAHRTAGTFSCAAAMPPAPCRCQVGRANRCPARACWIKCATAFTLRPLLRLRSLTPWWKAASASFHARCSASTVWIESSVTGCPDATSSKVDRPSSMSRAHVWAADSLKSAGPLRCRRAISPMPMPPSVRPRTQQPAPPGASACAQNEQQTGFGSFCLDSRPQGVESAQANI